MGKEKNINYSFKLLYAICIFFVACGHCYGGGVNILIDWFPLYSFHLAAFMFASGYFYNPQDVHNMKGALVKKVKHLLLPLYGYSFAYAFLTWLLRCVGFSFGKPLTPYTLFLAPLMEGYQWGLNIGGWYLAPLLFVFIINLFLRRLLGRYLNDWAFAAFYLLLGMAGIYGAMQGFDDVVRLTLYRCAYFLPFYGLGTLYRSTLERPFDRLPRIVYFGIIMVVQLGLITWCNGTKQYSQLFCNEFDSVIYPFAFGTTGILFWLGVAKVLTPVLGRSKFVLALADNAFSIMMNQFLGFFLVRSVFALLHVLSQGVFFADFEMARYFTEYNYNYSPRGLLQWQLLYVLVGLWLPIFIQKWVNWIKGKGLAIVRSSTHK